MDYLFSELQERAGIGYEGSAPLGFQIIISQLKLIQKLVMKIWPKKLHQDIQPAPLQPHPLKFPWFTNRFGPKEPHWQISHYFSPLLPQVRDSINSFMYESIPSLTIPSRAKPPGNFLDGRIPHPPGKKRVQNPDPPGL